MSEPVFADVFEKAAGFPPFDYQCRLACGPGASLQNRRSLQSGTACKSLLINVPTGLRKTGAPGLALESCALPQRDKPLPIAAKECLLPADANAGEGDR
jgi:hypothetical protein